MIQVFTGNPGIGASQLVDDMHRDRKLVFVDLLKWSVPVVAGAFEIDQFDTESAVYLVSGGDDGQHLGSIRLLPTERPHVLGSLFPELCDGPVPRDMATWEITRGCLSPRLRAAERLRVRNRLTTAAVRYALDQRIERFTCVADSSWLTQILALGWDCELLGEPQMLNGVATGALQIRLSDRTLDQLRAAGSYDADTLITSDSTASLAA